MEVSARHFLSSWHPLPVGMAAMPVNGMADLKLSFFFPFFFVFPHWMIMVWSGYALSGCNAFIRLSLSASHGHTELFCFDIEAYPRYPVSYSEALKLSLLYLLTTAPVIQLITVLCKIWISWIKCFSAWLALLTLHFSGNKQLVRAAWSTFWCAVGTFLLSVELVHLPAQPLKL